MKTPIRCLHENDYITIRDGKFTKGFARVYYGFNNYDDSPRHINEIVKVLVDETYCDDEEMHVHRVTREESIRHANYTMIQVTEAACKIKENLDKYDVL